MIYKLKIIFTIFSLCLSGTYCFAQNKKLDSLWGVYNDKTVADTIRIKAIDRIAWSYIERSLDTCILLAEEELKLANQITLINRDKWNGKVFTTLGVAFMNKGNYPKALGYFLESLKSFEKTNNKVAMARCYLNIGNINYYQAEYPKALEYYLKSLRLNEEIKDKYGIGGCHANIGLLYQVQTNYSKALVHNLKASKIYEELKDKRGLGFCYSYIGEIYRIQLKFEKALEYQFKSLQLRKEIGDKYSEGGCYYYIGLVYANQNIYPKAEEYFQKSLNRAEEVGDKQGIVTGYNGLAGVYKKTMKYKLALQYNKSALQISKEIGDIPNQRLAYENLAEIYAKSNNYKEAYENHVKFKQLTDSIFNTENSKQLGDLKTNFEVQKKELELKARADAQETISSEQKKRQAYIIYSVVGLLLIVLVFALFMFNRFRVTQKQKMIIEKQKGIVEEQKHLVEEKQKEIVDSITYAKRLQQAILPSDEEIKKYLPEHFLFYKPKDIVAGDFYWMEHLDGITFIAAADSTGHGVPGAMVSVVCSNALNRAVKEFGMRETGKILDKTRELVLETFAKSGEEIQDGMDISLLSINKKKKQIYWSGANNQLWFISDNQLFEIRPDKQSIGKTDSPTPFTTHKIELMQGDIFYLMTDGYADQFGGSKGKKYKYKQLEEKLLSNHSISLKEQKNILEQSFDEWKGDLEQVDDVTIIGIKV